MSGNSLNGFIEFKESILSNLENCHLFSFNYPLLIHHIIREAKLYRSTVQNLIHNTHISYRSLWGTEAFWNQIMMEHTDYDSMYKMTTASLTETLKYRDFKAAGTEGILNCSISSIILPLLADHVLREANHYIRILQCSQRS